MPKPLDSLLAKPKPFAQRSTHRMWEDPHISEQMLAAHLDPENDKASRNAEFIKRSITWITNRFNLGAQSRVLDLGCGPGLYAKHLAENGAQITAIDISARSIEYAKKAAKDGNLNINYHKQDYLALRLDHQYDLVLLIYKDYCTLSPSQRSTLLQNIAAVMTDGGKLLFDVDSLAAFHAVSEEMEVERCPTGGFWSVAPYYSVKVTHKYSEHFLYVDNYSVIEDEGRLEYFLWTQCFSPESLATELANAGFAVEEYLGNVAGEEFDEESIEFAVIAT